MKKKNTKGMEDEYLTFDFTIILFYRFKSPILNQNDSWKKPRGKTVLITFL